MTDSAAYSDVVFGLFWMLGYRFSPRLADIGGARPWRIDTSTSSADTPSPLPIPLRAENSGLYANPIQNRTLATPHVSRPFPLHARSNTLQSGPLSVRASAIASGRCDLFGSRMHNVGCARRCPASYRDLEAMMSERGVAVDHSTICRWIQHYAPDMQKRLRWQWRRARSRCCRTSETYVTLSAKFQIWYPGLVHVKSPDASNQELAA